MRRHRSTTHRVRCTTVPGMTDDATGIVDMATIVTIEVVALAKVTATATIVDESGRQAIHAAQIRTQGLGHHDAAIGLLIVFQHGHQGTSHGQS